MIIVAAAELFVGDETCDPASGCVCTVVAVEYVDRDVRFTVSGIPATNGFQVPRERQMNLRKKNDPFEC